jgi:hypothetical protein
MDTETTTVESLKSQTELIRELRKQETETSDLKKSITKQVEEAELKMVSLLNESGLKNFRCDAGLVSLAERLSVKTPKSPEDREAFFSYLRDKGLFDQMISVNSATLNSFYKNEFEAAKERGDDDFKIPGINEETMTVILSYRKV